MLAHSPEGRIPSYLEDCAKRLRRVETDFSARVIAAAMLRGRYPTGFWDTRFAPWQYPPELPKLLREVGILDDKQGSTEGSIDVYKFHTVTAIAGYGNESRFLEVATDLFGVDPGIKTQKIKSLYPKLMRPSFWNSLGGNYLMGQVYDLDKNKYRASLLSLLTTRRYFENDSTQPPLSEMVFYAADNFNLVEDENYRQLPDFKIAEQCIKPWFGHIIVRGLAKNVGAFQKNAFLPVKQSHLN